VAIKLERVEIFILDIEKNIGSNGITAQHESNENQGDFVQAFTSMITTKSPFIKQQTSTPKGSQ